MNAVITSLISDKTIQIQYNDQASIRGVKESTIWKDSISQVVLDVDGIRVIVYVGERKISFSMVETNRSILIEQINGVIPADANELKTAIESLRFYSPLIVPNTFSGTDYEAVLAAVETYKSGAGADKILHDTKVLYVPELLSGTYFVTLFES